MNKVLSLDELMQIRTIDDLAVAYLGEEAVSNDPDLLDYVIPLADRVCREAIKNGDHEKYISDKPFIEVVHDGVIHRVFGIIHSVVDKDYYDRIISIQEKYEGVWLHEMNLGFFLNNLNRGSAVEMFDHSVFDIYERMRCGIGAFKKYKKEYNNGEAKRKFDSIVDSYDELMIFRSMMSKDGEESFLIPLNIACDISARNDGFTDTQFRSYYKAVFGQNYAKKKGEHAINYLVGGGHMPEIAYFLESSFKDYRVYNLAMWHSDLASDSPDEYREKIMSYRKAIKNVADMNSSLLLYFEYFCLGYFFIDKILNFF